MRLGQGKRRVAGAEADVDEQRSLASEHLGQIDRRAVECDAQLGYQHGERMFLLRTAATTPNGEAASRAITRWTSGEGPWFRC